MSDTPLTDAAKDYTAPEKLHGLCKGLEVGLAEAKERIKELEDQRDEWKERAIRAASLNEWRKSAISTRVALRIAVRRLHFLQSASAATLTAMPDWSDESIDAELAKESEVSNG